MTLHDLGRLLGALIDLMANKSDDPSGQGEADDDKANNLVRSSQIRMLWEPR